MTWTAYYKPQDLIINLTEVDLGHPDRPDLWDDLRSSEIARGDLVCMGQCARGDNQGCQKTPDGAVFLRQQGSRRQVVHYPVEINRNVWSTEETDTHKALKHRIAASAERHGFTARVEQATGNRRRRADVTITGADGRTLRAEAQISNIDVATVLRRDRIDRNDGTIPLWVTRSVKVGDRFDAPLWVDRSPWTLIQPMPWQDIASGADIAVRGGVKKLIFERCGRRSPLCPERRQRERYADPCGREHAYFDPAHGVILDELVGQMAAGDMVDIRIPRSRRSSHYNIVTAADATEWQAFRADTDQPVDEDPDEDGTEFTHLDPNPSCDPQEWDAQRRATRRTDPDASHYSGATRDATPQPCRHEATYGPHIPGSLLACALCPNSPTYWRDRLSPAERTVLSKPLGEIYG